jgi:hypothetical protein
VEEMFLFFSKEGRLSAEADTGADADESGVFRQAWAAEQGDEGQADDQSPQEELVHVPHIWYLATN